MAAYKVEVTYGATGTVERREQSSADVVLRQETSGSEYARFEDLARKLVKVPKSAVDEQRKSN